MSNRLGLGLANQMDPGWVYYGQTEARKGEIPAERLQKGAVYRIDPDYDAVSSKTDPGRYHWDGRTFATKGSFLMSFPMRGRFTGDYVNLTHPPLLMPVFTDLAYPDMYNPMKARRSYRPPSETVDQRYAIFRPTHQSKVTSAVAESIGMPLPKREGEAVDRTQYDSGLPDEIEGILHSFTGTHHKGYDKAKVLGIKGNAYDLGYLPIQLSIAQAINPNPAEIPDNGRGTVWEEMQNRRYR